MLFFGATGVEVGQEALPYGAEVLGVEVFRIGQETLVGAKVLFFGATGVEVGQEALSYGAEVMVLVWVKKAVQTETKQRHIKSGKEGIVLEK